MVVSVQNLVKSFQKDFGAEVAKYGGNLVDNERIPTGIFPLDLMLGGGFPRSRVSIIWGRESSSKTNIALMAIANHQRLWPNKTCVFVDIEHSFDPNWAKLLGVDTESLVVIEPTFAEKVIDMVEGLLAAVDIGLIVIDSLAAMITTQEVEADATNNRPGGSSLIVGKLVRKTTIGVADANKAGNFPTIIYVNQTRSKIGSYGSPDGMPGGNAPVFQANIILRLTGKNIIDPKIDKVMPAYKQVQATITKFKTPVLAMHSKFDMVMIAHDLLRQGDTKDFDLIQGYLSSLGYFEKAEKGSGYVMLGENYPTLTACREKIYNDREFGAEVRRELISALLENKELISQPSED
jgi:recombination protein RecA